MRRYFSRLCWYAGLILVLVGFFYLPIPMVTVALLSALACYFSTSLFWLFLHPLFFHFGSDKEQSSERPGFIIILIGALMAVSSYFFPNIDWASFAILIMLVGGDWVFTTREKNSLLEDKQKQNSR